MTVENIKTDGLDKKTIIAERIEDGYVHLEIVENGEIIERAVLNESRVADEHIHDGMVVNFNDDGVLVPDPHASAFREREISERVSDIGERPQTENG